MKIVYSVMISAGILATGAAIASANQINTGGKEGAYYSKFCPRVAESLKKALFNYECTVTKGSRENIARVAKHPKEIGFSQADIFAHETQLQGGQANFTTIRRDLGRECLFLVTKDASINSYGEVVNNAEKITFVLPPEESGSAGTFEFLQQIDPDGLGKAGRIIRADTTDTAIDAVLHSKDDTLATIFVQFPDPDNPRFKRIAEGKGRFIPVIDRNILRQEVEGQKIYYPEETDVKNPNWLNVGESVVTACTPLILFTGNADLISGSQARADHKDLIKTVREMEVEGMRPKEGFFAKLFRKTRELSAQTVQKLVELSESAREKATPMMDKAMDKAKEYGEKAKETSKNAYEKAKEMGSQAMDKAEELADQAKEQADKLMKKNEE